MDPYRVLFVHPSAPQTVVRAAYHALARLYHPDLAGIPGADQLMAELNLAYAQVCTPEARATLAREHNRAGDQPIVPPMRPTSRRAGLQETIRRRSTQGSPAGAAPRDAGAGGLEPATMDYGRYQGWRLDEIARRDRGYLEWLGRSPAGRRFKAEIDRVLAGATS